MSEAATQVPPQPSATQPSSEPLSSAGPPDQTPASANAAGSAEQPRPKTSITDTGFKYGEDAYEWARGKTAKEVLELGQQFYNIAVNNLHTPQPQSQAPVNTLQAMTPQQSQFQLPPPPDPDLQYSNKEAYLQQLSQWNQATAALAAQQVFAQQAGPVMQSLAQQSRQASKTDPDYADIWADYSGEIDALMATMQPQARTDVGMWNQAAEMVAGKHRKEIAQKQAERLRAEVPDTGTLSGGSNMNSPGSAGTLDKIGKLFAEDSPAIQRFKALGMDARKLREHAKTMGHDPDAYADMIAKKTSVSWMQTNG